MKGINQLPLIRLALLIMLLPAFNKATGTPVENNTPVKSSFTIKINVTGIKVSDTVFLSLNSKFYPILVDDTLLTGVRKVNGDLDFVINTPDSCGFFSLYIKRPDNKERSLLMKPFFWERNDDIFINIDFKPSVTGALSTLQFSGTSKDKYQTFYDIFYDRDLFRTDKPVSGLSFYEADKWRMDKQLGLLYEKRSMLTQLNSEVIRTMIAYEEVPGWKAYAIRKMNSDTAQKKNFYTGEYIKVQAALGIDKFSSQAILNSFGMLKNRFNILETESNARFGRIDPSWMFRQIMNFPSTILRDRLLVFSFLFGNYDKNADSLFKVASSVLTDPVSQKQMRRMSHIHKQSRLKDSFLTDTNNQKILISKKFKGKALLLDFWFRGCGACIILHQNVISKAIKKFENRNDLLFLSINADIEKEKWLNYIKSKDFTIAANEIYLNTNGKGTNDPFIKTNSIVHYPTLILLDKNGLVKYFDTTNLRNYEGLAAAIGEVIEN